MKRLETAEAFLLQIILPILLISEIIAVDSALKQSEVSGGVDRFQRCKPVDCQVMLWSSWTQCSQTCHGMKGQQIRFRAQVTPASCNGQPCPHLTERRECTGTKCMHGGVVNSHGVCACAKNYTGSCCQTARVGWGAWSDWSSCTKSCGTGCQSKKRTCYEGPGASCEGFSELMKVCNTQACPEARYEKVGCYKDGKPRSFSVMVKNLRESIDWWHMEKTVKKCFDLVREKGWKYFGIQFFGECWSGPTADQTYALHGTEGARCWSGVGEAGSNYVYKIV